MITKEFYEKFLKGRKTVTIRNKEKWYLNSEIGYVKEKKNGKLFLVYAPKDLPLEYDLIDSYYAECMGCGVDKVFTEHFKNGNYEIIVYNF